MLVYATNWPNVWKSLEDTWLPMFGWIAIIVIMVIVIRFVRRKK